MYEGQDWFWLPTEPATRGWTTPTTNSSDFFDIFEDAPSRWPVTHRDETLNIWQEHTATNALATAFAAATADGRSPDDTEADDTDADEAGCEWGTGWATAGDSNGSMDVGEACEARVERTAAGLDSIDPASTDPAVKDTRTRGQQLLDGLISCVKLASRTGKLPRNGGLKAQLILSCSQTELEKAFAPGGAGTINTTFNGPLPLRLFDTALCDPEITRIVYGQGQEILNAGRTQRLFLPAQRRILYARDLGCSFPDCTSPATWTEAHHIIPWQAGGETSVENGCLLCSHHHTLLH
ncbi:HNH endonuclease signature motif containing protein, partial [Arthrobacter sp. HY1533]|uniref:HNH endonuclease signature motif containing protein n=1 Tax=Arthrobacter sp. HY1533 TaxID=2970919 RepID=UPI0022B9D734